MRTKLSSNSLNLYLECPRCFWLEMHGRKRPSGPMSTMPNAADLMIKKFFDNFRPSVPPVVDIDGSLVSSEEIKKLRGNVKLSVGDFVLQGRFDDCLVRGRKYYPMDYKTRGFDIKEIHSSYQLQLDVYALLLRENGFSVGPDGYLIYFIFDANKYKKLSSSFPHKIEVRKLKVDADRALSVMKDAIRCVRRKKAPAEGKECGWCEYSKG